MNSLEKLRSNFMRGKWSDVLEMCKQERALLKEKITGTGDTLLHLAVTSWEEEMVEKMVDLIVQVEESSDVEVSVVDKDNKNNVLGAENDSKNTPLHLAATMGSVGMCKKIGGADLSLIARRNIFGETPLFLAALTGKARAFLLLHYLYVDRHDASSIAHCIRDNNDTILHCAIAQGHIDVAIEIVHLYKDHLKDMMMRNREGLTPLHLLASKRLAFKSTGLLEVPILLHPIYRHWKVKDKNQATAREEVLKENDGESSLVSRSKMSNLVRWIGYLCLFLLIVPLYLLVGPLVVFLQSMFSEAVIQRWNLNIPKVKKKHRWSLQIMNELLQHASNEDMSKIIVRSASEPVSIPQLQTEDYNESKSIATRLSGTITIETPLMIAAKNGVIEMVKRIMELFPSRIKDVNDEGKNILLLAVEYRQTWVFWFLSQQRWLEGTLLREVDKEGNNVLHLAARLGVEPDWLNPGEAISMSREISWFEFVKYSIPSHLLERYNKKMETPEDIFRENHQQLMKSEAEWMVRTSEACSVVSTLVVSVAFATRTNLPGGYDENGYAILRNKTSAFKDFKDASFAALLFSLISTICFVSIVASRSQSTHHSWGYVPSRFNIGVYFMFASIVCLWISFCAADFFMLHDRTHKLENILPTYIFLSLGFILVVVSQLPIFFGPRLARILPFIPTSRRKATGPIQYRRTKNQEKETDLNRQ